MKRLLTTKEASEVLGISVQTLYKLVDSGKIKCYKITPRIWRFNYDEITKEI